MKLSLVTSTLHPGGSERVMSLLANNFAKRGYEVEIVCVNKHIVFYPIDEKVKIRFAENEVGTSIFKKAIWLRHHIKKEKPDVIIAFMLEVYCMVLACTIGINIPVISSERIDPHFFSKAKRLLSWILLRRTTHLVVQTNSIKNYHSQSIQTKTSVIPNPVTNKVFDIQPLEKENKLIAVGRLDNQKNYPMMIQTFRKIASDFPTWTLCIYGEGPERNALQQIILQNHLCDRVMLLGKTDRIIEEMNKSKVFVMTSQFEGMSNAMLEAVCVGLPVITTDVSGAAELVEEGKGGYIVKKNNCSEFETRLRKLLSDENLIKEMSVFNRNKASLFEEQRIVDIWEKLINKVKR